MPTLAFPDEPPTRPAGRVSSRTLALVQRIDTLAKDIQERLAFGGDDVIGPALTDLAILRHLCSEVGR